MADELHALMVGVVRDAMMAGEAGDAGPDLEMAHVTRAVQSVRRLMATADPSYGTPAPERPATDPVPARAAALDAAARLVAANMQRLAAHPAPMGYPYAGGVGQAVTGLADVLLRWVAPDHQEDRRV